MRGKLLAGAFRNDEEFHMQAIAPDGLIQTRE
jgi:hypothetical protein